MKFFSAFFLGIALFAASFSHAQTLLPAPAAVPLASPMASQSQGDYLLGPQDVLSVSVLNHPEFSVDQVAVTDGGRIAVPGAGTLVVAGKTVAAVQAQITRALNVELWKPRVTVSLRSPRPRLSVTVYVDGLVKNPGLVQLDEGAGVVQAIAQAGGLTVPLDDQRVVAAVRRGQEILKVDVKRLAFDPEANILLRRNDVVLLSEPSVIRVQVTGPVAKSGELRLKPNSTVMEAIAGAGNLTPNRDIGSVSILRTQADGTRRALLLDPEKLFSLRDLGQNVVLQDGDLISIAQRQAHNIFIGGQVVKPGSYEWKEGDFVADAIVRAGGPTEAAKLSKVSVTRRDGSTQVVDMVGAIRNGGARLDVPLAEGDYVVVPQNLDRVLVIQAVNKPGYYPIPEDHPFSLGEALALAGGPKDRARLHEVTLVRQGAGAVQRIELNLQETKKGKVATTQILQPGDVVFVPDGKLKSSSLSQFLSVGGLLGRLF